MIPRGELADLAGRRVTIAVGSLFPGGAERQTLQFAVWLKQNSGAIIDVVGFTRPGPYAQEFEAAGIPWVSVSESCPRTRSQALSVVARLVRHFRTVRTEIAFPCTYVVNVLTGVAAWPGGVRACFWSQVDDGLDRYQGPLGRLLERIAIRRCAGFLANSAGGQRWMLDEVRVPPDHHEILLNGVVPLAVLASAAEWRARLGVAADCLVFTMIARLAPVKDHATLLDAWPIVRDTLAREGRSGVLVLAGKLVSGAPEVCAHVERPDVKPGVHLLGVVDDVGGLLSATDLAVFASHGEGCPNGVLEPMSLGVAVAATRCAGVTELLADAPDVCLSPARDAAAFAGLILDFARDPERRRRVGAWGRAQIRAHHDPDTQYGETARVLAGGLGR